MSTGKIWRIASSSSDDTFAIGERLGRLCRGGEVIVLASDLGGGKTTLAKGLAKGLGCKENVGSPTFTVCRVYQCDRGLELHHFDFYRLGEPGVVAYELSEVINEPNAVVAVEWGDIVEDVLPKRSVIIRLERTRDSENSRQLLVDCPVEAEHLTGALK